MVNTDSMNLQGFSCANTFHSFKSEVNLALKFSINSVLFVLINTRSMKFLIMREKVC